MKTFSWDNANNCYIGNWKQDPLMGWLLDRQTSEDFRMTNSESAEKCKQEEWKKLLCEAKQSEYGFRQLKTEFERWQTSQVASCGILYFLVL
jgi:hypothetical protein